MLIILSIVSFSVAAMAGEPPTQLAVCRPSPTATVDDYMLWLGRSDVWGEDFADAADWTSIRGPDWLLNRWQTWVAIRPGRRLILSVPMLPSDLAGVSLEQGATGAYDVHYRTLAVNLVARGLGDTIVRLGWEFNGDWYPWAAKNKTAAFAAYWRRIVEAMRSVPGAQNLKFCWNPATGADEFPAEQAYPGDAYVDYVGLDVYDMSWAPNTYPWAAGASAAEIEGRRAAVWNVLVDGEHGIAFYQRFAAAHGKPFAFGEWGVAALPSGHGGGDNPRFVQNMHAYMATHPVAWATHFDVQMGASDHQLSPSTAGTDFPRARAKFLQCFGRGPLVSAFSSQQPGNEATKATDGIESDDSNRWSGSSAGYPQWIELDLGSDLPIDRARVVGVSGRAYRFRVEARPSGGGYQTVLDRSANTQSGPIADTFATTTARYVRLVVTGAYNDTSGWVSIREFTVTEAAPAPVIRAVSSQQVGNEAWKAVDGIDDNDNNRWSPDRASYPQWLELDLGANRLVDGVELASMASRAYQYRIEGRQEAGTYQTLTDRTANTLAGPNSDRFAPFAARYLRLTVTGAHAYTGGWVSIRELKVFGAAFVSAVSSQQPGNEASKAIDGFDADDAARWSANSAGYPQWLEVDLGANRRINGTTLVPMAGRAYRFYVEARPEGGSYRVVVDRTANVEGGAIVSSFAPTTARYVRLTVAGAHNYTGDWVSIRELKITTQ